MITSTIINMKRLLIIFSTFIVVLSLNAKVTECSIAGVTMDEMTKFPVDSVKVRLIADDNRCVDSTYCLMCNLNGRERAYFYISKVPPGFFTLQLSHPKYDDYTIKIDTRGRTERNNSINLKYIYLKRKARQLGEATVKATRIKMIHRGDTIVYDADAFELAEGSMLEALVKELPGVQLKEDGQIFVNGRRVDELLLNGKDFFRNDRLVLLENLPAYMVKNIKVFEKKDSIRINERKILTMDVVLKKEYAEGWIANAELAGGTNERYLGRLFGLRFTDHSRLSLFGNKNNVNDARKPGQDGNWNLAEILGGKQRVQKAGVDFYVEDREGIWDFNTTNEVNHINNHTESEQTATTFLPSNNVFSNHFNNEHYKSTHWTTQNSLTTHWGSKESFVRPLHTKFRVNMSYLTQQSSTLSSGAELDIPLDSIRPFSLPYIHALTSESKWFSHILNRTQAEGLSDSYSFSTDGGLDFTNRNPDISGFINWEYNKQNTTSYYRNTIDYPADASKVSDYRHQYTRTPTNDYELSGKLYRSYQIYKIEAYINADIQYHYNYHSQDRTLFELSKLGDRLYDLQTLPSTTDSLQLAFDAQNSYYGSTYDSRYDVLLNFQGNVRKEKRKVFNYNLDFPVRITHTKLFYLRNLLHESRSRTTTFFNPQVILTYYARTCQYVLTYNTEATAPSLMYQLNYVDDANPLMIQLNNPDLKNRREHFVNLRTYKSIFSGVLTNTVTYRIINNALAMGFLYDPQTGVRTTRPDNVNGNWSLQGNADYNGSPDKKKMLTVESHTGYGYLHSVDLTGTTAVERSKVNTFNLNEELSLKYKIRHHQIGVKGKVAWSNISSDRENFTNMNVADFNYGLTALLQLPWKLQFSTDLTMYSRRGYESSSMNTNDLVWNARLSRTFLGGSLTCFVDGFDLLGNLSNVNRTVNAQGRTETRYNVVPRYAMLHVIYRLNKQPKKKNQ